jgi:CDP-diacylglycerol--serine O-phosphatidyltransferase
LRLARFNTRAATQDKRFFEGLPSPSAAAIVSAFIWAASGWREPGLPGLILATLVTASAGVLMVSSFGYNSFKQLNMEGPVRFMTFLLVPLGFVLIALHPPVSLLVIFGGYALSGPILWLVRRKRRGQRQAPDGADGGGGRHS